MLLPTSGHMLQAHFCAPWGAKSRALMQAGMTAEAGHVSLHALLSSQLRISADDLPSILSSSSPFFFMALNPSGTFTAAAAAGVAATDSAATNLLRYACSCSQVATC